MQTDLIRICVGKALFWPHRFRSIQCISPWIRRLAPHSARADTKWPSTKMFSRVAFRAASSIVKPSARAFTTAAETTAPRGPIVIHSVAPRTFRWLEAAGGVYVGVWGCWMYSEYADHKVILISSCIARTARLTNHPALEKASKGSEESIGGRD